MLMDGQCKFREVRKPLTGDVLIMLALTFCV